MDLPLPSGTNQGCLPGQGGEADVVQNIHLSVGVTRISTFRNSTLPCRFGEFLGSAGSWMKIGVSSTSAMRSPEIAARGMKINNMERVKEGEHNLGGVLHEGNQVANLQGGRCHFACAGQMIATLRPVIIRLMSGNIASQHPANEAVVLVGHG